MHIHFEEPEQAEYAATCCKEAQIRCSSIGSCQEIALPLSVDAVLPCCTPIVAQVDESFR